MADRMQTLRQGGVAERLCVRLQGNVFTESEFIRVRIPSPPLHIQVHQFLGFYLEIAQDYRAPFNNEENNQSRG
jgi:hypothetical protein